MPLVEVKVFKDELTPERTRALIRHAWVSGGRSTHRQFQPGLTASD
jgi:hypothetical protein